MAFVISSLADYTEQHTLPLILKAQLSSKTAKLFTLQTGVKGVGTALNLLNTSVSFQNRGCGWSALGDVTFSQRTLVPGKIDVKMAFCPADLEAKWTRTELLKGALAENEQIPFAEQISNEIAADIASKIEVSLWKGNLLSANASLNKHDGVLQILTGTSASASTVQANAAAYIGTPLTALTKNNISSAIDAVVLALPAEVADKEDVAMFIGQDKFRLYVQAIKDANLFHYSRETTPAMEIVIPGTLITLYGVNGLNNTNYIVAGQRENFYYGVDLENDMETFKLFYAEENDEVRFISKFNIAVQVAYPNEIAIFSI